MPLLWLLIVLIPTKTEAASKDRLSLYDDPLQTVMADYKNYYKVKDIVYLGVAVQFQSIPANTNFDSYFQDSYQTQLRNTKTNDVADVAKLFGEHKYMIPISALTSMARLINEDSRIGKWGEYTVRSYAVGFPPFYFLQHATGGSRPDERSFASHWRPFKDNNGVSGHSFIGAVPFLVIARQADNHPTIKYLAYTASFATAWSRINDNKHFFSQAMLGWYMGWEAVNAVFRSQDNNASNKAQLKLFPYKNGAGMSARLKF